MGERIEKHKHLVLLAAMLLALVTQPLVAHESTASKIAYDLLIAAIAVAVVFVVFEERWERRVACVLAAPAVVLTLGFYAVPGTPGPAVSVAYHVSVVLFVGFAVGAIVSDVFKLHAIGFDDIVALDQGLQVRDGDLGQGGFGEGQAEALGQGGGQSAGFNAGQRTGR